MSRQGPAGSFRPQPNVQEGHGSYASNDQSRIQTLRCVFCNKDKQLDAFSKTQIQKATVNPYAPPGYNKQKKHISCKQCTASQTSSLTCMTCTRTKPLEDFAKSQRRNAEKARCLNCMKKREEEHISDSEDVSDDSDCYNETWHDIM